LSALGDPTVVTASYANQTRCLNLSHQLDCASAPCVCKLACPICQNIMATRKYHSAKCWCFLPIYFK